MRNYATRLLLIIGLLTFTVGFFAIQAVANSGTVSPPRLEFTPDLSGYFEGTLEVYGAKDQNLRVETFLMDWDFDRHGNVRFYSDASQVKKSATAWLQIEPREFLLPAGSKKLVKVSGRVPGPVPPGDYWSMFFVKFIPFHGLQTSGVRMEWQIGGSITVNIPGSKAPQGSLTSFTLVAEPLNKTQRLTGRFSFKNESDSILEPVGRIEIRDIQNKTVTTISIPPFKVLPGGEREVEIKQNYNLPPGRYIGLIIIDYGGSKLAGYQRVFTVQ